MPLFGKKKTDESKEKKGYPAQASGYPAQGAYPQASYPSQGAYPQGAGAMPPQPPAYGGPPGPAVYQEPPPGYVANPNVNYPRGQQAMPMGHPQMAPPQYQPVQNTYMIQGGFDAGARFDGVAQPHVPPPPPGCTPNMAQMAAAQGHNVVVTQQKADWFSGSGDGGYVIW